MGLLTDVADIIRNVVNSAVGGKTSSGSGGTRTSGSSSTSGTSGTKGTSAAASSGYYNPNKDYSAAILNAQKSGASQQVISRLQQERQNKINAQYGGVDPYKGSEDIMGTGGSGTGSSGSSQYASGWTPGAGYTEEFDADANLSRETLDKIQSFREQAKEGLISWSEANAAANALRAAEGGYTLDMSGNPSWVGPPEVEIPSFEEFLEQTGYDQYSEATQQRIQAAVDQAISGYNAQIEAANKDSDALARQAYVAKMLGQKNLDQQLSAAGYAGGMADSQRIQTEISYENNLQDIEEQRLAVIAELERAIRDAQLTGDLQGAQELQNYLAQMQQSWLTYVQNQQAIQNSNYWNQRQAQSSDYWNDRQLSADEKNTAYNRALELLSFGIMPGEDVLTQAGLSQQEAAAIRDRLTAEQIAAAGTRSGASSGGGSSSGGGGTDGNFYQSLQDQGASTKGDAYILLLGMGYSSTEAEKLASYFMDWMENKNNRGDPILDDPSLTVDMQSVLSLGYGPISAEALAELEKRGEVERYLDGNLIKFRRTTPMPAPSRTVGDVMGGSLPINRIDL